MKTTATAVYGSALSTIQAQQITLDDLPDGQLLDPAQAAAILRVGAATMAVWRTTGRYNLPYLKMGHRVMYRAGDLRKFIERRTRQHTGEAA